MRSVLLLLLLLAASHSDSSADPRKDDAGRRFVVIFPENIAYYHPTGPVNSVQVTALQDTDVHFSVGGEQESLRAGESKEFLVADGQELRKKHIDSKVLFIRSSKKITVRSSSRKLSSLQTALVLPMSKLGQEFFIPPVPHIQGTTDQVTVDVTERRPFTLFIVSGPQETTVTIGEEPTVLQPWRVLQVLVQQAGLGAVSADRPVSVLFGHSCTIRYNCTCGILQTTLSPASDHELRFFIPPFLATEESRLLISSNGSTTNTGYDPGSPLVETNGTALLYRPGLLLTLIPQAHFATCYVINRVRDTQNFAVILVHQDFRDGVRMGNDPLENPTWQQLTGTEFVSTQVEVLLDKSVLWHTSHKMAVYFLGRSGAALFGNAAPVISSTADFRGCLLDPEVVHIGDVAAGWRESVQYCRARELQLVSLSDRHQVAHIYQEVMKVNNASVQEAWIGMRRRSQTGEWYWLDNEPVNATNWKDGEPGAVDEGQCAIMSLQSGGGFGWSDQDCCAAVRPVCYRPPVLFPLGEIS